MAHRHPKEKIKQAELLYKSGKKPAEIAQKINVPAGTVRQWKITYSWDGETNRKPKFRRGLKEKEIDEMVESVNVNKELSDKEKLFCLCYVNTLNATMAYQRSFSSNYDSASAHGWEILSRPHVKKEIERLKNIKKKSLLFDITDIVEKQLKIAFADITDYVEFGQEEVPIMTKYGPAQITDEDTGEKKILTKKVNTVRFKESSEVDGGLIDKIKVGRDGASIELADREKALKWLSDYFMANPLDRHRIEYDKRKLEVALIKAQSEINDTGDNTQVDDGFLVALNNGAENHWSSQEDDSEEGWVDEVETN